MNTPNQIATIDCALVTIETEDGEIFGFDTGTSMTVETQFETEDDINLIVKRILRAKKIGANVYTGTQLTLQDNVFAPELVVVLQGGVVEYDEDDNYIRYNAPMAGELAGGESFICNVYSARHDEAGRILEYEKTSYPNCHGEPIAFNAVDDEFRTPEYTINSYASKGQPYYTMTMVDELPELTSTGTPLPEPLGNWVLYDTDGTSILGYGNDDVIYESREGSGTEAAPYTFENVLYYLVNDRLYKKLDGTYLGTVENGVLQQS